MAGPTNRNRRSCEKFEHFFGQGGRIIWAPRLCFLFSSRTSHSKSQNVNIILLGDFRMPPMPPLFITAVKDICTINTLEKLFNILCSDVYYWHFGFTTSFSTTTTDMFLYDLLKLFPRWPLVFLSFLLPPLVARDVITPNKINICNLLRNCSFIPKHSCVTTPNNTYDENYSLRSGHDKMQTTDYRMQTADCRPGTKCILGTKYTLHTEKWAQNAHWELKEFCSSDML